MPRDRGEAITLRAGLSDGMFNLALVTINLGPPVAFVTASSLTIADSEIPFKSLYVTAAR